jgi:hypothetical protein
MTTQATASVVQFYCSDVAELARFLAVQSNRTLDDVERHLEWFILGNPAWPPHSPIGCGLRAADGSVAGCLLYCPQKFRDQTAELLLLGGSLFYVDSAYLGSGGLVFLKYAELAKQWPLFCNSANEPASRLWKSFGAIAIPDSDHEFLGVVKSSGILEEALSRHLDQRWLSKTLATSLSPLFDSLRRLRLGSYKSADLFALSSPEQVTELPIPDSTSVLTGARGLDFVRWRYFSGPDRTLGVYSFRGAGSSAPLLVTVNQRIRGYREQIRALNVLDIFPRPSREELLLVVSALLQKYRAQVDVLVLRNMAGEMAPQLRHAGFIRRQFSCFNGWVIDKTQAIASREWYFVPADCDWLI